MYTKIGIFLLLITIACSQGNSQTSILGTEGTRFSLNGKPFPYTGMSFFNAIYNPEFGQDSAKRKQWMNKFRSYGINVLRIWAQWDNERGFTDACPTCSLYQPDGSLRQQHLETLQNILRDADHAGFVIELALFSHESLPHYEAMGQENTNKAVKLLTENLKPFRNLIFQIWNEHSDHVLEFLALIKAIDPDRMVTNSPGFAGNLGDPKQNNALDFLSPHTSRQNVGKHWEVSPREIDYLLHRYKKPVVDDEPARNGTSSFGGPKSPTSPYDQIAQILAVWKVGGYVNYHHDMFQLGYQGASTPSSGIPDPEFNPYHLKVFQLLAEKERYMQK
jgi:hypothetical protein